MGSGRPVTEDQFAGMFREFTTAFRLETEPAYAMDEEQAAYDAWCAGSPLPPSELPWWQAWLDQVRAMIREGRKISRVRVLAEPPTAYQRWALWGARWHVAAGEGIRYLARADADHLGIPMGDWWLFDNQQVVAMQFTASGEIGGKTLITGPDEIRAYIRWHDLAVAHSVITVAA